MYLHLGQNTVCREEDVIGIFDMDNATYSKWTVKFLNNAEKNGKIVNIGDDIPRSFVVASAGGETTVYFSQLNSATLRQRLGAVLPAEGQIRGI